MPLYYINNNYMWLIQVEFKIPTKTQLLFNCYFYGSYKNNSKIVNQIKQVLTFNFIAKPALLALE